MLIRRVLARVRRDDGTLVGVAVVAGALLIGSLVPADPSAAGVPFARTRATSVPRTRAIATTLDLAAEPAVALDARTPVPTLIATAPGVGLSVSEDGGWRWRRRADRNQTHALADLATDARGRIYLAELTAGGIVVSTSTDGGRTVARRHVVARGDGLDRPWVVARGDGSVSLLAADVSSHLLTMWQSTDAARTFRPVRLPPAATLAGAPVIGPFATLHVPYVERAGRFGRIGYAASADGGRTWSAQAVAILDANIASYPSIAIDNVGGLYAAWSASGRVLFTTSHDHGRTWRAPVDVAGARGGAFPQVVAGGLSKAAVSFVRTRKDGDGWELVMLRSTDALEADPSWQQSKVAPTVIVEPCARCGSPAFPTPFESMLDTKGRALFAFVSPGRSARVNLSIAQQAGGRPLR